LTALVILVAGELVFRLWEVEPVYRASDVLGWQLTPNLDAAEFRGAPEPHRFEVSSNADGLRGAAERDLSPGVFRVVVLGDSVPFGWGVGDQESLVGAAQAALEADPSSFGRFELINAAQSAFSTEQIGILYAQVVHDYQPDLVVVFLPLHDHHLVWLSDQQALEGGGGLIRARIWMLRHVRWYTVLRRWIRPEERSDPFVLPKEVTETSKVEERVTRVSDDRRGEILDGMMGLLAEHSGRLALGFLPIFPDDVVGEPGITQPGEDWARQYAGERGVDIVDLRTACREGGEDSVFSFDPGHFTSAGNALIGREMAKWVIRGSSQGPEIP